MPGRRRREAVTDTRKAPPDADSPSATLDGGRDGCFPSTEARGARACRPRHHLSTSARRASRGRSHRLRGSGPGREIIAGGHSLLPMMKLRLANPEHLIDINDLDELAYIREEGGEIRDRRADASRRPAHLRAAGGALPAVRRRRDGDRRPGRPQPRHDRRLALPGGRRRGPLGRLLGGEGEGRDPRRRGRARRRDGGLPRRPVHDRGRRRRAAHRGPPSAAPGRRQRAREGRAPRRRLGPSPPPRPPCGSTAARSATPASRSARSD